MFKYKINKAEFQSVLRWKVESSGCRNVGKSDRGAISADV